MMTRKSMSPYMSFSQIQKMCRCYGQVIPQQRRRDRDGFMFYVQEVFIEQMCNRRICPAFPVWYDAMAQTYTRRLYTKGANFPLTPGIDGWGSGVGGSVLPEALWDW